MPFVGSYAWKVRQKYGHDLLLLPASSVVVEREDGAILLAQQKDGRWGLVAGYAEAGEGYRQAALTELTEEAAIRAKDKDLIPFASLSDPKTYAFTYPNGDQVQVFINSFIVRKWEKLDQPLDETEILQTQFFALDNLPDNILPTSRAEITAYKEFLQTGEFQSL